MPRWANALVRGLAAPSRNSKVTYHHYDEGSPSGRVLQGGLRASPPVDSGVYCATQSANTTGELYLTLRPRVSRMARALLRYAPPDELVHDVCVDAVLSAHRFRGDCAFSSWLYVVVTRHVQKWVRAEYRRICLIREIEVQARANAAIQPDDVLAARKMVGRLNHALAALSERQRVCLMLVRVEELPARDVAERLGVTPEAVRMSVHRARARLRKCLDDTVRQRG
jgi:RNA polymerase sigma-70 factor (ECF subfamily)